MKFTAVLKLLPLIMKTISPELRKEIENGVEKLETKAKTTPHPVDDIAVAILKVIVDL